MRYSWGDHPDQDRPCPHPALILLVTRGVLLVAAGITAGRCPPRPMPGGSTARPAHAGFTLVELSIVLVIVGLLAGGILVGRDLIKAAEIRATVSQYDKYNSAVNTFRLKFNCVPGDCLNAATFFPSSAQPARVTNGDGNGTLDSIPYGGANTNPFGGEYIGTERASFFDHLAAAQVIPLGPFDETDVASQQSGVAFPKSPLGPRFIAVDTSPQCDYCSASLPPTGRYFMLGVVPDPTGNNWVDSPGLVAPADASALDVKVDDGRPLTGGVEVLRNGTGDDGGTTVEVATPAVGNCISPAVGNPYLNSSALLCTLAVRAKF